MKKVNLFAALVMSLGFICNANAALLAPFTDVQVKAGERVYVYYGLVAGLTNKMICKANSKHHDFNWASPVAASATYTWDEVSLTTRNAEKSGVMIFNTGKTDGKLSCDYFQDSE